MDSSSDPLKAFFSYQFTHLVIGGGTAGLVVATRLAESPDLMVGVLEAGSSAYDEPRINIPGRFGETLGTEYDWQFATTSQPGLNDRSLPWPRGRVLGGTSALNFMTWNRGCREDYDAWEKLGNEGWGWDELLPFFQKTERLYESDQEHRRLHQSHSLSLSHGTSGPVHTSYSAHYGASHQHWHSTLEKLDVPMNHSHFSGSNVGAWTSLTSVEPVKGERSYSATAYYRPNASRANLILLTEAVVQRIILEQIQDEWVATGAVFEYQNNHHSIKVMEGGEVILCAGAVQSPQILELSGIGNPKILERAGIEVKVSNPAVGENLQDHMMTATVYEIDPSITTLADIRSDPALYAAAEETYKATGSGPLTAVPSSVAYLPFSHFIPTSTLSEIPSSTFTSFPETTTTTNVSRNAILAHRFAEPENPKLGQIEYNFDLGNYNPYFTSQPGKKYATMLQMLQYPCSVGSVHIPPSPSPTSTSTSTSIANKPLINPKYYEGVGGALDFRLMVASQHFGARICATAPLASILRKRVFPPQNTSSSSTADDDDFTSFVRDTTITDWHPVGTCSMGPRMEGGYVVDARLRVHGVRGLRVVDASVMPLQISAHLQATVYAIGEKGAGMILEDWVDRRERGRG